jgi:transcriptional regulator of acetoin/glycerol metabolism
VPAVFGPSQTRLVTAARDELCAALLDQGWSPADVARALGLTRGAPGKSARRHWSRIATVATRRTAHVG